MGGQLRQLRRDALEGQGFVRQLTRMCTVPLGAGMRSTVQGLRWGRGQQCGAEGWEWQQCHHEGWDGLGWVCVGLHAVGWDCVPGSQ